MNDMFTFPSKIQQEKRVCMEILMIWDLVGAGKIITLNKISPKKHYDEAITEWNIRFMGEKQLPPQPPQLETKSFSECFCQKILPKISLWKFFQCSISD